MASNFNLTIYNVDLTLVKKKFKHYVTKNLSGNRFLSDTPFAIKFDHRLLAIDDKDLRTKSHEEIRDILKTCHGRKLGKIVKLTIAIPTGPRFQEVLSSPQVQIGSYDTPVYQLLCSVLYYACYIATHRVAYDLVTKHLSLISGNLT